MAGRRRAATVDAFRDITSGLRFEYRPKPLMGAVARKVATAHRGILRRGQRGDGTQITEPVSGQRPLRRSGELLKSLKGVAKRSRRTRQWQALVWASGGRDDSELSNAALLAVQIHGRKSWTRRPRNKGLMELNRKTRQVAIETFEKVLQKQLDRGQARIVSGARSAAGLGGRFF